jgi:hypothetical protein
MKPGFKTSEFWLTVVFVVVALVTQSDALAENESWVKIAGLVSGAFALLGYTRVRGTIKQVDLVKEGDDEGATDGANSDS